MPMTREQMLEYITAYSYCVTKSVVEAELVPI
jgi:hypothetical protein